MIKEECLPPESNLNDYDGEIMTMEVHAGEGQKSEISSLCMLLPLNGIRRGKGEIMPYEYG